MIFYRQDLLILSYIKNRPEYRYRSIIPALRMLRWKNFDINTYLSYIERLSQILYSKVGCGCSFLYTQHSGNWNRKIIKFEVSLGYLECSRQAWATEQDPVFKKKC